MKTRLFLAAAGLLMLASGCGSASHRGVESTAEDFYAAAGSGDGAGACALLAPKTRSELEESAGKECAAAVLEEDIPEVDDLGHSQVYGTMAQVSFSADTAFLTRFRTGWRIMAVLCSPVPDRPYDCKVSG
jgi:hypothetical protein